MTTSDILVYVEDPGAANLILGLGPAMKAHGLHLSLWADGAARSHLAARGEPFLDVGNIGLDPDMAHTRLVAVGTSEALDSRSFALLDAARAHNVPTVGLVDSPASAAARFRGTTDDPLAHMPDRLIVTDTATRDAFAALGVDPDRITVAENPALSRARTRATELAREDRTALRARLFGTCDAPVIVFLTELSDGLDRSEFTRSADYTLSGRGTAMTRTHIVLESLLDAAAVIAPRPSVFVRLHPKDDADAYRDYADEIAGFSTEGDPLEICHAADLVVGMTTTLLSECREMGQRVLSVIPRTAERGWLADVESGVIPSVSDMTALRKTLAGWRELPTGPRADAIRTTGLGETLARMAGSPAGNANTAHITKVKSGAHANHGS